MNKVTNIDDYRPHVCISTEKSVHVVPVSVFEKIVSREMEITEIDDWEDIAISIISDWLNQLKDQND
jgi:hypothetical protein